MAARAEGIDTSITVTSDKVWRGFSKTRGRPSLSVDGTYRADGGWFVGAGVADLRSASAQGRLELTLALGREWRLDADHTLIGNLTRYVHVGGTRRVQGDYSEASLALDWRGQASVMLAAAPDNRLGTRDGWTATLELAWHQRLAGALALDAGYGWYQRRDIGRASYGYGSVGLSYSLGPVQVVGSRVFSDAVSRGGFSSNAEPSRWLVSVVLFR